MRPYGLHCALARALDVVGERWTLLIVRELLAGPRYYGELLEQVPGIATNLLAERLRHLRKCGVVRLLPNNRYALTSWGEELRTPIDALGEWADSIMATHAQDAGTAPPRGARPKADGNSPTPSNQ